MKNSTQKGFGIVAAILIVAALTVGSYAAVKVNQEIKSDAAPTDAQASEATTTPTYTTQQYLSATSTATTTTDINIDADIRATSSLQLGL